MRTRKKEVCPWNSGWKTDRERQGGPHGKRWQDDTLTKEEYVVL